MATLSKEDIFESAEDAKKCVEEFAKANSHLLRQRNSVIESYNKKVCRLGLELGLAVFTVTLANHPLYRRRYIYRRSSIVLFENKAPGLHRLLIQVIAVDQVGYNINNLTSFSFCFIFFKIVKSPILLPN